MSRRDMASLKQSAIPVLKGARISDVAKAVGITVCRCRLELHAYCRKVNRPLYEELSSEAAIRGIGSPTLCQLRNFAEEFLALPEEAVNHRPLSVQAATVKRLEFQLRKARIRLAVMSFDRDCTAVVQ